MINAARSYRLQLYSDTADTYTSYSQMILRPYDALASIISGCMTAVLHWELELFSQAVSKLQSKSVTPFTSEKDILSQLYVPRIIIDREQKSRINVREVNDLKVIQQAGKKGKKGKKAGDNDEENKRKLEEEKADKRKAEEEERMRKWEEDWDKKLKAQETLDKKMCCMAEGYCLKPKTQSNIWVKVVQDKTVQDVQFAFKQVPVPKPKPPPLPKLIREDPPEPPMPMPSTSKQKKDKKKKK